MMGCVDERSSQTSEIPPPPPSDTGEPSLEGSCGEVGSFDMAFQGFVEDRDGQRLEGVTVALEERSWTQQIYKRDVTDVSGEFKVSDQDLPMIEGCWGTVVSFWLVGSTDTSWGERPLNAHIIEALDAGRGVIELTSPLILSE